jgi:hypothetical protein
MKTSNAVWLLSAATTAFTGDADIVVGRLRVGSTLLNRHRADVLGGQ